MSKRAKELANELAVAFGLRQIEAVAIAHYFEGYGKEVREVAAKRIEQFGMAGELGCEYDFADDLRNLPLP